MPAIPRVTVDFAVGNTIEEQIQAMLELAYRIDCIVKARLNDVLVEAYPLYDYGGAQRRRRNALLAKYETDLRLQQKENQKGE